jgi:hypothetical protein
MKGISMALNDEDITTSGDGGEGPADGGSNPQGHAVAATLLGGKIAKAVLIHPPGGDMEGKTVHAHVPEGAWSQILYAGPWAEARWLKGRRPTQAETWAVLADSGQRDYAELSMRGGVTAGAHVVPLIERCWDSVIAAGKVLHREGAIAHHDVCAALGLSTDPETRAVELSAIRSGSPPGTLRVSRPAPA